MLRLLMEEAPKEVSLSILMIAVKNCNKKVITSMLSARLAARVRLLCTDARRIKHSQGFLSVYKYQHIYMPLLYGLLGAKYRYNDMTMLFGSRMNGAIRINAPGQWHMFNFVAGKVFFFTYRFFVPWYLIGFWNTMLFMVVSDMFVSYILALVFQVNHVVDECEWPEVKGAYTYTFTCVVLCGVRIL